MPTPLLFILSISCSSDPAPDSNRDSYTQDSTPPRPTDSGDTTTPGDTATADDSGSDTTVQPPPPVDCAEPLPVSYDTVEEVANGSGFHDLAFLDDRLVGSDNRALLSVDSTGAWDVFRPGLGRLEQFERLPDGDLAVSSKETGDLLRLTAEGGTEVMIPGLWTYGVTLGPDAWLYVARGEGVIRVNPDTLAQETLLEQVAPFYSPRIMDFSPDLKRLYITTLGNGTVFVADLDPDLNVTGPARVFAELVGGGHHDALAVDICGNLYVADYNSTALWRITHDGVVTRVWDPPQYIQYGHGAEWGTGRDGWSENSLFLPQPYNNNTAAELDLGLPSNRWVGEVLNAPYLDD